MEKGMTVIMTEISKFYWIYHKKKDFDVKKSWQILNQFSIWQLKNSSNATEDLAS